jgi:hypothetical protein
MIAGVPAEIRTEHILTANLERYNYTNLLGIITLWPCCFKLTFLLQVHSFVI